IGISCAADEVPSNRTMPSAEGMPVGEGALSVAWTAVPRILGSLPTCSAETAARHSPRAAWKKMLKSARVQARCASGMQFAYWEQIEEAVLMGRNFENRKNAIFKTAGQKSKLYSRYGKQLYVAAKNGVPDPLANPALRSLIEKAKRDQVPAHVI